jgi:hypothetical protein
VSDRNGLTLQPGDPVLYRPSTTKCDLATVLREVDNGYLIQLDPIETATNPGPFEALTEAANAAAIAARAVVASEAGIGHDDQEAFEVSGSMLEYFGEMEWADDEEEGPDDDRT